MANIHCSIGESGSCLLFSNILALLSSHLKPGCLKYGHYTGSSSQGFLRFGTTTSGSGLWYPLLDQAHDTQMRLTLLN